MYLSELYQKTQLELGKLLDLLKGVKPDENWYLFDKDIKDMEYKQSSIETLENWVATGLNEYSEWYHRKINEFKYGCKRIKDVIYQKDKSNKFVKSV